MSEIKPVGAVIEVWSGEGRYLISRTKLLPVDQLPFVSKQLNEQTSAWCKYSFELRPFSLCRYDEAASEITRLTEENKRLRKEVSCLRKERKAMREALEPFSVLYAIYKNCDKMDAVYAKGGVYVYQLAKADAAFRSAS